MTAWNPALTSIRNATVMPPEMVASAIKKSERPLMVVGSLVNDLPHDILDRIVKIIKKGKMDVALTGGSGLRLNELRRKNIIGVIELVNNLKNPDWEGFDGNGNYDLVCFIGVPYYIGSQGLSTLKAFAPHLKTVTLCRYMHPNADMSYPSMKYTEWLRWLDELIDALEQ
ncbi:CO dehydrogenase/acetyl-CoA synthase complex subunit epsilon [Methanothermobacter sp. KEPCO-1]|uniref:CO dehydrogenase/acetyl-CoA synthase complex subunit epsilon n=1 Tax=unclassified Methanothermobacter TaxID=2631116 RepID=UPI0011CAA5BA|nr:MULTISPECIES: CO dehydrogenase/acetyl-CoA synthase complex subunit epsilon [unclassified Methanothermobacter]QEF94814.1 CO dehydrogenase/acetyl-CoA synthase complex subunit epsilon [Methanothermobacter sp. KEPCO-1]